MQSNICVLLSTCDSYSNSNQGVCTSGELVCDQPPDPSEDSLVLVAFGRNGQAGTNIVELLDLKNLTICSKVINLQEVQNIRSCLQLGILKKVQKAMYRPHTTLENAPKKLIRFKIVSRIEQLDFGSQDC